MPANALVWPRSFSWCSAKAASTPTVESALRSDAAVAIAVSGGKDSCATAFVVIEYLDQVGHGGPRILIHSDLGELEWHQSRPVCERLAERLGLELVVVQRQAGGLLSRWRQRWTNNKDRYANLQCVKLILPWSTAAMRFCTSELKTAVICRELVRRFPGQLIVSAAGVRRQESARRATAAISSAQPRLSSATHRTSGVDWYPIVDWSTTDVFEYVAGKNFELHEAYRLFGSSRVSCAFCILASHSDLKAAARCQDNFAIYRSLVELEIESTFSFQNRQWLCDIAPHLLDDETRRRAEAAKQRAARREAAEQRIPPHLFYEKGWPKLMPTPDEATVLAAIRREVGKIVGCPVLYTDPDLILARYAELIALKRKSQMDGRA